MLLSLLKMFHGERGQFRSPEAASQEDSDHGVVTLHAKIPMARHRTCHAENVAC